MGKNLQELIAENAKIITNKKINKKDLQKIENILIKSDDFNDVLIQVIANYYEKK